MSSDQGALPYVAPGPPPVGPTLVSIAVTPASPSLITGSTLQFVATGTYSDTSTADVTSSSTWGSATPAHATISAGGLATGVAPGTSVISATIGAVSGNTTLTDVAAPSPPPEPGPPPPTPDPPAGADTEAGLHVYYYIPANFTDPVAHSVELTSAIRLGSITGLVDEAEMGAVGEGNLVFDDVNADLGYNGEIVGLKRMFVNENDGPIGHIRLWTGWIGDRRYHRGQGDSLITGVQRKVDVTLVDENALASFRVFAPVALEPTWSFVRPAETDIERITAMLGVAFLATSLFDVGYVNTVGPVNMDANDYTGSTANDVLNDCAQQSGKNFFVMSNPDESDPKNVLWYDKWSSDGSATIPFDSTLSLTNVLSEHNGTTVFAITPDAVGVLDPSRVVAGVYLPYSGGTTYRKLASTEDAFAYRDVVAPSVTVKSLAQANIRADRYLAENATEDNRISCTVQLPSTKATLIRAGMRIQAHFTHIPGVDSGMTWCRILRRTVRQDQETNKQYWLDLELSPQPPTSDVMMSFAIQRSDSGSDTGFGYGSGITPSGTLSACGDVPIVPSGTSWTYLGGGRDRTRPSDYPFDVAYRVPVSGETVTNHWGADPPNNMYSDGRGTVYSIEVSGTSGAPSILGTLVDQAGGSGGPLVGPSCACPSAGWLFGLFSNSTGGPDDGRTVYDFAPSSGSVVSLRQSYASDVNTGFSGFAPKAWLGYLPVAGAGSHSITLNMSASTGDIRNWGCIMVFVPGDALAVTQFIHTGNAVGGNVCWTWTSAP